MGLVLNTGLMAYATGVDRIRNGLNQMASQTPSVGFRSYQLNQWYGDPQ